MSPTPDLMLHALAYAARGWSVVPLHTPTGQAAPQPHCSCRSRACDSPGKHPRTQRGLSEASLDPDQIRRWWTKWPDANIGIVTGKASGGLTVIDVDHNRTGEDSLRDLTDRLGDLPETVVSLTGNGMHILFLSTNPIPNSVDLISRGIDVRGEGGYIVAPPSLHRSGRRYEWEGNSHPDDIAVAMLPVWLADLATSKRKSASFIAPEIIIEGGRNETLFKLGCKFRRSGVTQESIEAMLLIENEVRCQPPLSDDEVRKIAKSAASQDAGDPYYATVSAPAQTSAAQQQAPQTPASPALATNTDWTRLLIRKPPNKQGVQEPIACGANVTVILMHDPEWKGVIVWDAFRCEERTVRPPPWFDEDRPAGEPTVGVWTDEDSIRLANWLARTYGLKLNTGVVAESVKVVSRRNAANPVLEYLQTIEWDGVSRLNSWLSRFMGVAESEYASSVGRWWLVSAVARIFRPGCKADHVLILEGDQGAGKSSALRALMPTAEWFCDTPFELGDKDSYLSLRGRWIVELAELDSLSRSDAARAKAFFSSQVDSYRPPYGRNIVQAPRQCVFAGTVNPDAVGYLVDATGGRRFWPVECGTIDLEGLAEIRDQLWAEAAAAYHEGQPWWPDADAKPMLKEQQAERLQSDVWEPVVAEWLCTSNASARVSANGGFVTTPDLLGDAIKVEPSRWTKTEQARIGRCMSALGWERKRRRVSGVPIWVYMKPADGGASETLPGSDPFG